MGGERPQAPGAYLQVVDGEGKTMLGGQLLKGRTGPQIALHGMHLAGPQCQTQGTEDP